MAKADYLCCDKCDRKVLYDGYDTILHALIVLGLDTAPILCEACRAVASEDRAGKDGGRNDG